MRARGFSIGLAAAVLASAKAEPPVAQYVFPAGAQRGNEVPVRVGGLFFHGEAGFIIDGPGVIADPVVKEIPRIWFEGPLIHQPASQRSEDYPRDHAAKIAIDKDAVPGPRRWHCATSQGLTATFPFIIGDLPEVVETEQDGEAVPVSVKAPVTINGRIFPRQDRDIWEFEAAANEWIDGEIMAKRLGYPLEPNVAVTSAAGQAVRTQTVVIGGDPRFTFRAPAAGRYRIEIGDGNYSGGQHFVYRLTLRRGADGVATAVHPLGGQRGKSVALEFSGPSLDKPLAKTITLPADPATPWHAVDAGNGASFFLQLGDDPEIAESSPTGGGPLPLPGVANGRISRPGERDDWRLDLKKGQAATFEIFAARLGTRLDAKIAILDAEDKELATNDDPVPNSPDSRLAFAAPADGTYRVRVTDRFASRGGQDFGYRLHARAEAGADYRLILGNESLTVVRDSEPTGEPVPVDAKGNPLKKPRPRGTGIAVTLEPIGAYTKGDVTLEIEGLPAGVTVDETTLKIPFARKTTEVFFDAAPDCPVQTTRLIIRGTAEIDGQKITRQAEFPLRLGEPAIPGVRLAVAPAVPFSFVGDYWVETGYPIGSRLTKTYRLERKNFDGPLQVEMSDRQIRHLQGVTAEPATIPPGADTFSYTVTLPPRMEMGRTSRVQLMISGEIADRDGRKHRVSYTNAQPEQQMMSIVSEGRLSLDTENPSVRAEPGRTVRLPVTVKRDRTLAALPIQLTLVAPATAAGIESTPIKLAPGQENAEIEIRFGPKPGPFLDTVKLRAATVSQDPKEQHEAELELEMVPAEALTAKR